MIYLIGGKVLARAEALTGPTTPPGKRVQTINPPGSEVGPGTSGAVATWGKSLADEVDAMGFKRERKGRSSKQIPFSWNGPQLLDILILLAVGSLSCFNFLLPFA
jgi:hypothetical protein